MTTTLSPFGERSLTLVAAHFDDRTAAERAAAALVHLPEQPGLVQLIEPGDPQAAVKLEPEQAGIWRTLLRSHLVLGTAGLMLGLAVAAVMIAWPWPAAVASPGFTLLFAAVMGGFVGMIGGGLLTLRPDHAVVIRRVRGALSKGRYAVVVRPLDALKARAAMAALREAGAVPVRSF